jgi:ankyrin repeat protein
MQGMKLLIIASLVLPTLSVSALDHVEANRSRTSMSGRMTGATSFQFGVWVRGTMDQKIEQLERELRLLQTGATEVQSSVQVSGTLDQKIDQVERELRLLQFTRDSFPRLLSEVSYSGTNRLMSQCLVELSRKIGEPIPMELGTNDFKAKEFVFEGIPLVDVLKYLVAFDDAILDVSGGKLVCRPVRQALGLNQAEYDLLELMAKRQFHKVKPILADKSVNVRKIRDERGQNLLHLAAWHDQTSIAKRLIALGVDVNAKNESGYTPLHEAVRFGNRECAGLLLEHGADVNIADNNNDKPLETAIYFGYLDLGKALVDHGAKLDIFTASGLGLVDQVRKFLDQDADHAVTQQTNPSNQLSNVGIIVTTTTDPRRKSPGSYLGIYGATPLHWAARGGGVEVARLLISRGESISAKDSRGETPLFWAAAEGRLEAAEFLVKHGADINATNDFGGTPLLIAARETVAPELIKFLVKAGADVNARDDEGENALHKLAWFGYPEKNVETARILLDVGADITARNKDGVTPLDVLLDNSMPNDDLIKLYRKYYDKKSSRNGK